MSETDRYRMLIALSGICALVASALFSWVCVLVFVLGFTSGGLHACIQIMKG